MEKIRMDLSTLYDIATDKAQGMLGIGTGILGLLKISTL